jgi:hypothetical protein
MEEPIDFTKEIDSIAKMINEYLDNDNDRKNDLLIKTMELSERAIILELSLNKRAYTKKHNDSVISARETNKQNGLIGKIRIGKIGNRFRGKTYPITYGYRNINCSGEYGSLISIKDDHDRLFENVWRSSIGEQTDRVDKMNSPEMNEVTKGDFVLWPNDYLEIECKDEEKNKIDFLTARRSAYLQQYYELVKGKPDFAKLRDLLQQGYNLQLLDKNYPIEIFEENGKINFPYDQIGQGVYGQDRAGSVELSPDIIEALLTDKRFTIYETFALALALLKK